MTKLISDDLVQAILTLKTPDDARCFLRDLCTPGELRAFSQRWAVVQLLEEGQKSYRDISADTGASVTTVGRVARFLNDEPYQGYRLVLERLASVSSSSTHNHH